MRARRFFPAVVSSVNHPVSPPSAVVPFVATPRLNRWCWGLALGLTVLWFWVYAPRVGDGFCDEPGHLGIMRHFHEGRPGWPDTLPHPPGYHYVVLWLTPGAPTPMGARTVTLLFALGLFTAFGAAWRRLHGAPAGPAVLLLALLPIMQPFTAMIYTDVPALALVFGAWWAQLSRRGWLAGLLLAAACLIRQTSVLWGSFFLLRELWLAWRADSSRPLWPRFLAAVFETCRQSGGLIVVHILVATVILVTGRLTPGTQHGNALQPNLATLHFGAVLLALLGLPLWLTQLRAATATLVRNARQRPVFVTLGALAFGALIPILAHYYRNPHIWNQELWWDNPPFTLLRNWPLIYADRLPILRWLWSVLAVVLILTLMHTAGRERFRDELFMVSIFGVVLLATNGLVEPRYFITPAAFWLFFRQFNARQWRVLVIWFGVLCVAHAPFIARKLSLW